MAGFRTVTDSESKIQTGGSGIRILGSMLRCFSAKELSFSKRGDLMSKFSNSLKFMAIIAITAKSSLAGAACLPSTLGGTWQLFQPDPGINISCTLALGQKSAITSGTCTLRNVNTEIAPITTSLTGAFNITAACTVTGSYSIQGQIYSVDTARIDSGRNSIHGVYRSTNGGFNGTVTLVRY
jgi:hypothetical protein